MGNRSYWYVANELELFVDLDLKRHSLKRTLLARARLRGAMAKGVLQVEHFTFYDSVTPFHYHLMIKLKSPMAEPKRILWESRLCDDLFRNNMNTARLLETGRSWSLLISAVPREGYWREPDYVCECAGKHRAEVMANCPIAKSLDCVLSADHFGNTVYRADKILLRKRNPE